jgi:hypothetical protein
MYDQRGLDHWPRRGGVRDLKWRAQFKLIENPQPEVPAFGVPGRRYPALHLGVQSVKRRAAHLSIAPGILESLCNRNDLAGFEWAVPRVHDQAQTGHACVGGLSMGASRVRAQALALRRKAVNGVGPSSKLHFVVGEQDHVVYITGIGAATQVTGNELVQPAHV